MNAYVRRKRYLASKESEQAVDPGRSLGNGIGARLTKGFKVMRIHEEGVYYGQPPVLRGWRHDPDFLSFGVAK